MGNANLPTGCSLRDIERQCECGPCDVCGGDPEVNCVCPECPICGEIGRLECYGAKADQSVESHGMLLSKEQRERQMQMVEKRRLEDERDRLIDLEYEKALHDAGY